MLASFYLFNPKIHTKECHQENKANYRPLAAKIIGHGDDPINVTSATCCLKVGEIVMRITS